jgi:hypothetical protein
MVVAPLAGLAIAASGQWFAIEGGFVSPHDDASRLIINQPPKADPTANSRFSSRIVNRSRSVRGVRGPAGSPAFGPFDLSAGDPYRHIWDSGRWSDD